MSINLTQGSEIPINKKFVQFAVTNYRVLTFIRVPKRVLQLRFQVKTSKRTRKDCDQIKVTSESPQKLCSKSTEKKRNVNNVCFG